MASSSMRRTRTRAGRAGRTPAATDASSRCLSAHLRGRGFHVDVRMACATGLRSAGVVTRALASKAGDLGTSAVMTTFWHPFADMAALEAGGELTLVRGEGSHVWDVSGQRYLDATAGLWFANVGHGRTEIAAPAADQMRRLAAYHTFGDLTNEPTAMLTDRVAGIAPMADAKVFLTSGRSDSVDPANKMGRR